MFVDTFQYVFGIGGQRYGRLNSNGKALEAAYLVFHPTKGVGLDELGSGEGVYPPFFDQSLNQHLSFCLHIFVRLSYFLYVINDIIQSHKVVVDLGDDQDAGLDDMPEVPPKELP